jgi:hypothetical protein
MYNSIVKRRGPIVGGNYFKAFAFGDIYLP